MYSDFRQPLASKAISMSEPVEFESATQSRCSVCGSLLDEEDLFCANCGTEAPGKQEPRTRSAAPSLVAFECQSCGAAMSYSAREQALRCPFCGSVKLLEQPRQRTLAPELVVPFQINPSQAQQALLKWLSQGFWRPGDLTQQAQLIKIMPVYLPYWVFEARVHTYWTADTSCTPAGARADWYPISGENQGEYRNLLVGASGALSQEETQALCPFDLAKAVPPNKVDFSAVSVEPFALPRRHARPQARQSLEQLEYQACTALVPGRARNVHVNVLVTGMSSRPVLLPVWIMAYRYRDRVYRFLVNGQTGRCTGTAPISWWKVTLAGAFVALVLVALGALGWALAQ